MITVRKLFSLKSGTRERKIIKVLGEWELSLQGQTAPERVYLLDFFRELERFGLLKEYREKYGPFEGFSTDPISFRIEVNRLRHELLLKMGISPADWDIIYRHDEVNRNKKVFPSRIFLDEIRSPYNLGSIFRTAECMGVQEILLSPGTADPNHPRAGRTSMGCTETVSWRRICYEDLGLLNLPLFAMELGGTGIHQFSFPGEGVLILGSEELGVSPECLNLAQNSKGVITIPLYGNKASLNVSVAFGIIMNAWSASLDSSQR